MIPGQDDDAEDRLARGEAVPGGPGACDRDGCTHLTLWHGGHGRYRGRALPPVRLPGLRVPAPGSGHPRAIARRADPVRDPALG